MRSFQVGDQVFARPDKRRIGSFAERIAVHESDAACKPSSLSHTQAAAIPLAGLTAWQALTGLAKLESGQKVFVEAGAGGVGVMAIQIAKHLGAQVATTASAAKHELLRSLGADEVIDYRSRNYWELLRDYDIVMTSVGAESLVHAFEVVRPGGIVISLSAVPDPEFAQAENLGLHLRLGTRLASWSTRRRARARGARYRYLFMSADGTQLAQLADLAERELIRPVIDRVFPFSAVDQAIEYAEAGHATGKVVVSRESGGDSATAK